MVEFNLLPDIKLAYLKSRRLKRTIVSTSVILSIVFLAIFILLFLYINIFQKYRIDSLNTNINSYAKRINSNTNLNKILTIQNQLNSLPGIENQLPVTSRIFNYMSELTPVNATISDLNLNLSSNSLVITGNADSLSTVNQFIDTLKFTKYQATKIKPTLAFSSIILSSFSYTSVSSNSTSPAQYTINLNYDPNIFNNGYNIKLIVPSQTTTRSIISQPLNLFKARTQG